MSQPRDKGPTIRVDRKRGYTVVFNDEFQPGMSARAWGIYCFLRMQPDGWEARAYHLQERFEEGRDAIYTALGELVDRGMVAKEEYRDGNLRRYRYVLDGDGPSGGNRRSAPDTDSQDAESPDADDPDAGSPDAGDPPQVSTDLRTTDEATKDQPGPGSSLRDDPAGETLFRDDRKVVQIRPADPVEEQARSIVTAYMDWWAAQKGTPIIDSSRMFNALVKNFVVPALRSGVSDRTARAALAACARAGHEWPAARVWRQALDGKPLAPSSGGPSGPDLDDVWDERAQRGGAR